MKQMSFDEAKRLSMIKWDMLSRGFRISELDSNEEIRLLIANCGFCERHQQYCENCEFGKAAGICQSPDSLFGKWRTASVEERPLVAKEILTLILCIKEN